MYCVYYSSDDAVMSHITNDLSDAIDMCERKRKAGFKFVTMAIEDPNMVGKMGVSDKLPDDYDWVKRRDAISVRRKGIV